MTKAAQIAVARGLAELTASSAVTVNTVLPGPTRSRGVGDFVAEMAKAAGKSAEEVEREFFQAARPTSLLKRFASPEEVAALVTFVASPLSSATNGAALRADGGVIKTAFQAGVARDRYTARPRLIHSYRSVAAARIPSVVPPPA